MNSVPVLPQVAEKSQLASPALDYWLNCDHETGPNYVGTIFGGYYRLEFEA